MIFVLELVKVDVEVEEVVVVGEGEDVQVSVQTQATEVVAEVDWVEVLVEEEVVELSVQEDVVGVNAQEGVVEVAVSTSAVDVTFTTGAVNVTANVTSTTVVDLPTSSNDDTESADCTTTAETIGFRSFRGLHDTCLSFQPAKHHQQAHSLQDRMRRCSRRICVHTENACDQQKEWEELHRGEAQKSVYYREFPKLVKR
jgi:hypothetical protein